MEIRYNYRSIKEIDHQTLDYLRFVVPENLDDMEIQDINDFLNRLEDYFVELYGNNEHEYD